MFHIPPAFAYLAAVVFDKGFSLVTIPLAAAYLAPGAFGRLDVAVSVIEFTGLLMAFGIAETLVRFAGTSGDAEHRRKWSAELMGTALVLVIICAVAAQLAAPWIAATLGVGVSVVALQWGLMGAAMTALVELPLVWLRLNQQPVLFFKFIAARSIVQMALMWGVLAAGYGADGVLIANAAAVIAFGTVLSVRQIWLTGISFSARGLRVTGTYGVPLVGAALAMFALGSLNRLFLNGRVADAEIAYFALAMKLALATPLILQPFALWWGPRRIALLDEPDGLALSARYWGIGVSILLIGATGICLVGPLFVTVALPATYAAAIIYLPFAVLVCALNEFNTLCNVGAYARKDGLLVLTVNVAGASTAVAGYAMLVPHFGVPGAITAIVCAHVVRLCLFLLLGRATAPVPYRFGAAAVAASVAVMLIAAAPASGDLILRAGWSGVAVLLMGASLVALGLLPLPTTVVAALRLRSSAARAKP